MRYQIEGLTCLIISSESGRRKDGLARHQFSIEAL